ncbi:MAG: ABC transporter substrate-binding protein [Chitinispirillaceae bacterium]|nr:ABC transporter substrate-binding protein [Chitinispirillaceae bacterium]
MEFIGKRYTTLAYRFLLAAVALFAGCGGKTPKIYHVGVLSGLDFFYTITDGFKERMNELGYKEGTNITYDIQKTDFNMAEYKKILNKFVADGVDLILVFPTEASMEAKVITKGTGIPMVFANAFTENTELVATIRAPGGNVTGVRWDGPDLALQRFEIMLEIVPHAGCMWVPYQRGYPIVKNQLEALRQAFTAADMEMTEIPADNAADLETALQKQLGITRIPDAILVIAEPLIASPEPATVLAAFAAAHRIPVGGNIIPSEGNESIFGIIPGNIAQGRQAAFIADKIFRGTSAGIIPVVTAENFLTINYKAAVRLGLQVNEGLLGRAHTILR